MLNRKFASIRANVKIDKRNSVSQKPNQRMSQSQSMDMQTNYHHRNHSVNNNILMNLSKEAANRSISQHERRTLEFDASPLATPMRSPIMKSSPQHPYVNLLHQPNYNIPPYQLQYQNSAPLSNQSTPDPSNQQWHNSQPIPLVTHYTAAQIYMRPKVSNSYNYPNSSAYSSINKKPPPPEVPKRLSSSISTGSTSSLKKSNGLSRSSKRFIIFRQWLIDWPFTYFSFLANNGSLQSVQSSGSESSVSIEKIHCDNISDRGASPLWKRSNVDHDDDANHAQMKKSNAASDNFKISEIIRKRKYRIGLNLFNKKPEKGIEYLVKNGKLIVMAVSVKLFDELCFPLGFLENTSVGVAKFLISRKGLSRQMIGEYLGMIQQAFNMSVLDSFCEELDLSGTAVDVALRKFQSFFRMPGEAQKIERLMQAFSERYSKCNPEVMSKLKSPETVSLLLAKNWKNVLTNVFRRYLFLLSPLLCSIRTFIRKHWNQSVECGARISLKIFEASTTARISIDKCWSQFTTEYELTNSNLRLITFRKSWRFKRQSLERSLH